MALGVEVPWFLVSLVALLVLLLVSLLVLALHSGLRSPVVVRTGSPPVGAITVAYKSGRGPYGSVGPVFTEAASIGPRLRSIGLYYDDPAEVPSEQTRYAIGSILSEGEPPAQDLVKIYEKSGFKIFSFPEVTHAVTTTFPFGTFLSIYLAIWRVFPAIKTYTEERKLCAHPCVEVYTADTIHYFLPLARQSHFYVPEVEPKIVQKKGPAEHSDTVADNNGSEATGRGCGSQESVSMATADSISGMSTDTVSMATSESTSVCPTDKRVNVAEGTSLGGRAQDGAAKDDSGERSDSAGSSSSFEELRVEDDTSESTDVGTRGEATQKGDQDKDGEAPVESEL
uniref:testis-expressed protein 264 n=1 Tax=Myxine glutinosa TaxID=7769 RepID=UPI00358FDCC1